jgi:hypothetical protein
MSLLHKERVLMINTIGSSGQDATRCARNSTVIMSTSQRNGRNHGSLTMSDGRVFC